MRGVIKVSIILQINAEIEIHSDSLVGVIKKLGSIASVQKEEKMIPEKETDEQEKKETMTIEEFTTVEDKAYTLEEVRAKLTSLSRAGKREAVNQLIKSYGVKRLTDIPTQHYAELMQKAGEL